MKKWIAAAAMMVMSATASAGSVYGICTGMERDATKIMAMRQAGVKMSEVVDLVKAAGKGEATTNILMGMVVVAYNEKKEATQEAADAVSIEYGNAWSAWCYQEFGM